MLAVWIDIRHQPLLQGLRTSCQSIGYETHNKSVALSSTNVGACIFWRLV